MMGKYKKYILTLITTIVVVSVFAILNNTFLKEKTDEDKIVTVGFIYEGDESTPYTANFVNAVKEVEKTYGERVQIIVSKNVRADRIKEIFHELASDGCEVVFAISASYADAMKELAAEYPDIQICQAAADNANEEPEYSNYHTFMGRINEGRYVSGVVAGLKAEELVKRGVIKNSDIKIGYVGAFPNDEVISGYKAFLHGVRSIVPNAVMLVKYTDKWSDYILEKRAAGDLIDKGCVIISQHSDTVGPAVACEENFEDHNVFHVGYNQSMTDVAPKTSLVSVRINWTPYIVGAIGAVLNDKTIEDFVEGEVVGNDTTFGFEGNWVQMLEINKVIAADGTEEKINETIDGFVNNTISIPSDDDINDVIEIIE